MKTMASSMAIPMATEGNLSRYLQDIRKFPMLSAEEELSLALRWRDNADEPAAHKLVTSHLRLVAKIAMGYRGYGLPMGEADFRRQCRPDAGGEAGSTPRRASVLPPTPCGGSAPPSRNTSCALGRS
jgi:hypothetical protein